MTEPTDAEQPDPGADFDPELTADLTAQLGGPTSFFPAVEDDDEPAHAVDTAEHEVADDGAAAGDSPLAFEAATYEDLAYELPDDAPLAPVEPGPLAPGEPGTAGAALADLAGDYGETYEPYYGTPQSPWSSNRLEAIMRDTVDAQVQEQRQLETLLIDVRAALADRAGAAPSEDDSARTAALDRLAAELAAARAEQAQRFAELSARIDALVPAPQEAAGPSIQDLHDGLAGVRTDMSSLPEQIGPAVTSAVTHGIADQLGLLPEAVAGIRDLTARIANLEASATSGAELPAPAPAAPIGPELAEIVDQQLGAHLEAFGTGISAQLDAVRAQVTAVEEGLVTSVHDRLGAFEERLAALHEVLVALHGAEERELPAALGLRLDQLQGELRAMRLANDGPSSPMTAVVAQVHASEQRLAHHVDEAVLALAQAVLRRRPGGGPLPPAGGRAAASTAPNDPVSSPAPGAAADPASEPATEPAPGRAAEPALPADELAAAEMDDVNPGAADEEDPPAHRVAMWTEVDDEEEAADEDEDAAPIVPAPDVLPGRTEPGQDPRRGLFRRRP